MRNNKLILLLIGLMIILQHQGLAQSNENQNILSKDGAKDSLYSNSLGEQREFWIQLPEGFNPDTPMAYPVVYLLD